jgi:hypothetical protein
MGMHEGRAQSAKAMKDLAMRWSDTKVQWNDATTKAFEARFLTNLEMDFRQALGAMDQMSQVLMKIRRDVAD